MWCTVRESGHEVKLFSLTIGKISNTGYTDILTKFNNSKVFTNI